jgi:maleate cis-trans isomerase
MPVLLKGNTKKGKKLRTVLITFLTAVTKYLAETTSKEEEFVSAHGFRDFSP